MQWLIRRQILASERALSWQLNDPNYFSMVSPPAFKPAKKDSDVSGLLAHFTDPQSKLPAPPKSFPAFGGCHLTLSLATWP